MPLTIGGDGAKLGATFEHAVRIIDGSPLGFSVVSRGKADTMTTFVYELPALTTFGRFAVPNILETPSPSATFTRTVEVHGSYWCRYWVCAASIRDANYTPQERREHRTDTGAKNAGALDQADTRRRDTMPRGKAALEFSEIIGNGVQDTAERVDHFQGLWKAGARGDGTATGRRRRLRLL